MNPKYYNFSGYKERNRWVLGVSWNKIGMADAFSS